MKIFLFLFSLSAFTQAIFSPKVARKYFPGDFVEGKLRFGQKDQGVLADLEGQKIANQYFVHKFRLDSPEDASVTLIPLEKAESQKVLDYKGIKIDFSTLVLGVSKINPQSFIILQESLPKTFWQKYWLGIVSLFSLLCTIPIFWKVKKGRSIRKLLKLGKEQKLSYWKEKIRSCVSRAEFEDLYNQRKEWVEILAIPQNELESFMSALNKHQFKKSWTEAELLEVQDNFKRIKNGI